MLTQLFLAARMEKQAPLPYVRHIIRLGLAGAAARLNQVDPTLATQFLDVRFSEASLSDRFLLSSWGTLTARLRPLLTETVVRCFAQSDFAAQELLSSEKPVTVYLRWPERDLLALSPLVRLLWGTLIDELITSFDQSRGAGVNQYCSSLTKPGERRFPPLPITPPRLLAGGLRCGWPCNPSPNWKPSTARRGRKCYGTTWRAKSTTGQLTWQLPSIWKRGSGTPPPMPTRQPQRKAQKRARDWQSGLFLC